MLPQAGRPNKLKRKSVRYSVPVYISTLLQRCRTRQQVRKRVGEKVNLFGLEGIPPLLPTSQVWRAYHHFYPPHTKAQWQSPSPLNRLCQVNLRILHLESDNTPNICADGRCKITQRSEGKHISLREKAPGTVFCWITCKHTWGDFHSEAGTLISFYRHTPWTGDGLVADPPPPNLYSVVYCT